MLIGGLEKFTLIDYPGNLAAVVFTVGCNFRCHYCHNPLLVLPDEVLKFAGNENEEGVAESVFFDFLKSRTGKLDGVVITGGEPTLQFDLEDFVNKIKNMGFRVKLDTNGTNPEMLAALIKKNLIDYVAMDIKSSFEKYSLVVGVDANLDNLKKSVIIIMNSGLPYEFRTTVVPGLVDVTDIEKMGKLIKGAEKWYLQVFRNNVDMVDKNFKGYKKYKIDEIEKMKTVADKYVKECKIR